MSLFGRTLSRLIPVVIEGITKTTSTRVQLPLVKQTFLTKSFSCLSSPYSLQTISKDNHSLCSCGCNGLHTKGDQELVSFLQEEISEEKKSMSPKVPAKLDDFSIKHDQSEVVLTKKFQDEEITISMDVNHSVDAEGDAQISADGKEAELKSRPNFEVDVKVGGRVLSFTCSYIAPEIPEEGKAQDTIQETFGINEVTIYDGEWSEQMYCVSGDILDETLYDLLMNYLEERGVTEEFAEKLSDICSDYEHSQYVGLLQKVQDFVNRK